MAIPGIRDFGAWACEPGSSQTVQSCDRTYTAVNNLLITAQSQSSPLWISLRTTKKSWLGLQLSQLAVDSPVAHDLSDC